MPRNLQNMVVLITGASAGIGRELALQLHAHGARLALSARRLEKLEDLNRQLGGAHLCVRADISDPIQCAKLIEQTVAHFGRLDTLVANAGYGLVRRVYETTNDEIHQIFRTNVFGTSDCIAAAIPHLRRNTLANGFKGQVMIVSSAAARRGLPHFGAYSATKAAQLSLTEALRVELKRDSIAVTSVHPIGTDTDFFSSAESLSAASIEAPGRSPVRQSAATVARAMVRAIRKPRREVWPYGLARWALALNAIWPAVGDAVMVRMLRQIEKHADREHLKNLQR